MAVSINTKILGGKAVQRMIKNVIRELRPPEQKKLFRELGGDVQQDLQERWPKQKSFDNTAWPTLKPATIERKKKIHKRKPLVITGLLRKFNITSLKSDEVVVASEAPYAKPLNERKERPFLFAGIGRPLLKLLDNTLKRWMDKLGT